MFRRESLSIIQRMRQGVSSQKRKRKYNSRKWILIGFKVGVSVNVNCIHRIQVFILHQFKIESAEWNKMEEKKSATVRIGQLVMFIIITFAPCIYSNMDTKCIYSDLIMHNSSYINHTECTNDSELTLIIECIIWKFSCDWFLKKALNSWYPKTLSTVWTESV